MTEAEPRSDGSSRDSTLDSLEVLRPTGLDGFPLRAAAHYVYNQQGNRPARCTYFVQADTAHDEVNTIFPLPAPPYTILIAATSIFCRSTTTAGILEEASVRQQVSKTSDCGVIG